MTVAEQPFGAVDGKPVSLFTLTNAAGMVMKVTNYGGIVTELHVPHRDGKLADVVLGFDNLEGYLKGHPYFGCIVGRFGNRIAGGRFTLDGKTYKLAVNSGPNCLHGGIKGFDKVIWNARPTSGKGGDALELSYASPDGEEAFPGTLNVKVVYTLTRQNEWRIDYSATTDRKTVINLTQHAYFNLAGTGPGDILGAEMMINADAFTPIDRNMIPTGEIRPVVGTPLDFTQPAAIGARIDQPDEQLQLAGGYDHNFILNKKSAGELSFCARVRDRSSGRCMEVSTTEPAVQLYTGNFLDGSVIGKGGKAYQRRSGFCLETQHYPDSPNQPAFPTTVLSPGQIYRSTTIYKFIW